MAFHHDTHELAAAVDASGAARVPGKASLTQRLAARPPAEPVQRAIDPASAAVQRARLAHDLAAAFDFTGPAAVQRKVDPHTGLADGAIADHAARGVSGAGGVMPHLEAIQRSFGPAHDLSGVRAHVGGAAADASAAIGAHAYATGNDVAFAASPDLFLAAHEATHVVQQRHGVSLKGAVGQDGDAYEQHADAVAAAVVRGEDVSAMLGAGGHRGATVQRFASEEHAKLGDEATGGKRVPLADDYQIAYGDLVAIAGDYFEGIDQLRALASVPGRGAGTREEIDYVIDHYVHGGSEKPYSEGARKAADDRYYLLLGKNDDHYLNNRKDDQSVDAVTRASRTAGATTASPTGADDLFASIRLDQKAGNAASAYRRGHVRALREAFAIGRASADPTAAYDPHPRTVDDAHAADAYACHFLTDAFSAGHIRTQRTAIADYWNPREPMFVHNTQGWIAQSVAAYVAKDKGTSTDLAYYGVPMLGAFGALDQVKEKMRATQYQFGDLIGVALHELDGNDGIRARSGGAEGKLLGDHHLGEGREEAWAVAAVQASVADVELAFALGAKGSLPVEVEDRLMTDGLFAAEARIPTPVPDAELPASDDRVQWWNYTDALALIADRNVIAALRAFGTNQAAEIEAVAAKFEDPKVRDAVINSVVARLKSAPEVAVREILLWTPDTGGGMGGHNQDDNASDYVAAARAIAASGAGKSGLASLRYQQRYALIASLLDGVTSGQQEVDIVDLLKTAPAGDARRLITDFGWQRLADEIDDGYGDDFEAAFPKATYGTP